MGPRTSVSTPIPTADIRQLTGGLRRRELVVVDLRSPSEFARDHLPGARNAPLFDDVERRVIGTLYARRSPEEAFEEGRRRTLAGVGSLCASVAEAAGWEVPAADLAERVEHWTRGGLRGLEGRLVPEPLPADPPPGTVVLHCWRGGLRSRSVLALVRGLGLERAVGLAGGYKAWRGYVRAELAAWRPPPAFVLRGWTGVGKTLVLRALERLRPGWTLDLEGLAGHRSSILGMVGLEPCSQKAFETRLVQRLWSGLAGHVVLEGESRKVGDVILPPAVWRALQGGTNLWLEAPLARRVEVLVEDYLAAEANREELARQLPFLEQRLGQRWRGELTGLLEAGREHELVEVLLARYYDPRYAHSERGRRNAASFDATDPEACAAELAAWIEGAT